MARILLKFELGAWRRLKLKIVFNRGSSSELSFVKRDLSLRVGFILSVIVEYEQLFFKRETISVTRII